VEALEPAENEWTPDRGKDVMMNTELAAATPLFDWLRRQRRLNHLQLELMTERFDLDGAAAADQPELVWWATLRIVAAAVRSYLMERGVTCQEGVDWSANTQTLLGELASIDAALADEVWELLLRPAPRATPDLVRASADALQLAITRLGAKQLDRATSIRDWADGVRLLREVAVSLGIAAADSWYLTTNDVGHELSWYDEVMSHLGTRE
jgi:hypothetical protein